MKLIVETAIVFFALLMLGIVARSYVMFHVRQESGDKTGYMACVFVFTLITIAALTGTFIVTLSLQP